MNRLNANKQLMSKAGIICIALFVFFGTDAAAQNYKMGLGVRFSSRAALVNTSISAKYFFNEKTAVEALFCVREPFALGLLAERHKPILSKGFSFFYGAGAYAGFSGPRRGGLHGIAGLDYKAPMIPLNLSIDWKPELTFTKEFSFEPAALGVTARFTLK
jgi:hypothetical protein